MVLIHFETLAPIEIVTPHPKAYEIDPEYPFTVGTLEYLAKEGLYGETGNLEILLPGTTKALKEEDLVFGFATPLDPKEVKDAFDTAAKFTDEEAQNATGLVAEMKALQRYDSWSYAPDARFPKPLPTHRLDVVVRTDRPEPANYKVKLSFYEYYNRDNFEVEVPITANVHELRAAVGDHLKVHPTRVELQAGYHGDYLDDEVSLSSLETNWRSYTLNLYIRLLEEAPEPPPLSGQVVIPVVAAGILATSERPEIKALRARIRPLAVTAEHTFHDVQAAVYRMLGVQFADMSIGDKEYGMNWVYSVLGLYEETKHAPITVRIPEKNLLVVDSKSQYGTDIELTPFDTNAMLYNKIRESSGHPDDPRLHAFQLLTYFGRHLIPDNEENAINALGPYNGVILDAEIPLGGGWRRVR